MRFIPSRIHGVIDYLTGTLLIAAPFVLDFYRGGVESWVPILLGAGIIAYSLFTRYEMGAVKALPFQTHLVLDMAGGILLAASPWLFGFAEYVSTPHLLVGLFEVVVAGLTHPQTEYDRVSASRPVADIP